MVSHKNKIIFVHIPKTGGTSIEASLGGGAYVNSHHNLAFYKDNIKDFESYTSFSVVRNPFDKMVSEYSFFKKTHQKLNPAFKNCSFEEFLNIFFSIDDFNFFKNSSPSWFKMHFETHRVSQLSFLHPQKDLDFLVKFENIQSDYNIVCDHAGIKLRKLPHLNSTHHKHYSEYYNDNTKQIVADKYQEDIEFFGYEF